MFKKSVWWILLIFINISLLNGNVLKRYSISGHVRDATSGEELIGASVYVKKIKTGTITNSYGFYSISLKPDVYEVVYSYMGFKTETKVVKLTQGDVTLNIELSPETKQLEEVEVSAKRKDYNIQKNEMSVQQLDNKSIKKIPALMGEVDVIKAIQLLPGVQATSEGSSGFSVRGGSRDQNLILLDEATVYNASHFVGFFSVFNNDAIKDVKLFKGDIPAQYGGRLSSLLDVRMKDGNLKKWGVTGGIGTVSSRLTIEGPVVKEKSSVIISGRRTYADLMLLLSNDEIAKNSTLYFYDLNAKYNLKINDNNRIFISGYNGEDIFKNELGAFGFGNTTGTFRWNHLFSKKLFSNLTVVYSNYDYLLGTEEGEIFSFEWTSNMQDISIKDDYTFYLNPMNTIKFGASATRHVLSPGHIEPVGEESIISEADLQNKKSNEFGLYLSDKHKINTNLTIKAGLRLSGFQNVGKEEGYVYDENYEVVDTVFYDKGEIFKSFWNLEPRVGLNYVINSKNSIKMSYNRTTQYLQMASNSTAGSPLDIYFTASPNVKPQMADQFAVGYFRNFYDNRYETSVEVFYKEMNNTIDFKDYAELIGNPFLEGELRTGSSDAYGIEFLVRKNTGKLNGWLSYTYSRVKRDIPEINDGEPFPAYYDKPHSASVILNYEISKSFLFATNWVYSSGNPVTFPVGRYEYYGSIVPIYSKRNEYRYPDYHRMDVSLTYMFSWGDLNLSVYNVYDRHNVWTVNFVQDETDPTRTYAEKTYLFSVVPTLTLNFDL